VKEATLEKTRNENPMPLSLKYDTFFVIYVTGECQNGIFLSKQTRTAIVRMLSMMN